MEIIGISYIFVIGTQDIRIDWFYEFLIQYNITKSKPFLILRVFFIKITTTIFAEKYKNNFKEKMLRQIL